MGSGPVSSVFWILAFLSCVIGVICWVECGLNGSGAAVLLEGMSIPAILYAAIRALST